MLLSDKFICSGVRTGSQSRPIPAPLFKKEINIDGDIEKAEITVSALGFYELWLNDKKITRGRLCPYITNSDDAVFYDNYDITDDLPSGINVLEFLVGNGMQNCCGGYIWDFDKAAFRSAPKLAFAVEITYKNGSSELIEADESVLVKNSKILSNDIRLGEKYDATAPDAQWKKAKKAATPKGEGLLSTARPIKTRDELKPVKIWKEGRSYIYDFGINTAGVCRLNINAAQGQKIRLTFAEVLTNGKFDKSTTTFEHSARRYFQRDIYICKEGENIWEPSFTYHGFRYVKVDGITQKQATDDLLTYVVFNTDLGDNGSFICDDDRINTLHKMSLNSTLSNFHHFPTDCPQREKNGWTADAALSSAHTLLYFEPEDNYRQWLVEICKAQNEQGALPGIVPTGGWGFEWGNGPAWDSVITELPYQLWQKRNDLSPFEYAAPYILKYIKYLQTRLDDKGLLAIGLGDWCAPGATAPLILTDSIEAFDIATKAAMLFCAIGDSANAEYCSTFAKKIRKNIRAHLYNKATGVFIGDCQTSQAMGIYYGIVEKDEKEKAFSYLLERIEKADYHLTTGVLGGRVLFHALAQNGEIDTAMRVLTNPTSPSYMQWINNGDTALCEGFTVSDGLCSHNHHFWGFISDFLMTELCGIKPQADKIYISPDLPSGMNYAKARLNSIYGEIIVELKRENEVKINLICDKGLINEKIFISQSSDITA